jgi:hypothetical protein
MEDTGTLHLIQKEFSVGSTTDSYAVSFFVKANGRTSGNILYGLNAPPYASITATFNLTAGTITAASGANGATAGTSKIENYGNGWYRVSVTGVLGTAGTHYVRLQDINGGVAGDPTKGFFVYGFQAELGAHPTTLIPTTTAAVTRLADAAYKTGISSLIGQTEGTLFIEVDFAGGLKAKPIRHVYNVSDGTDDNRVVIYIVDNSTQINLYLQTPSVQIIQGASFANVTKAKIAFAYKSGQTVMYVNGTLAASSTDAFSFAATLSKVVIGARHNLENELDDRVSQALLFKTRLTNAQLAELTTL